MPKSFEELPVWCKARELAKYVYGITRNDAFSRDFSLVFRQVSLIIAFSTLLIGEVRADTFGKMSTRGLMKLLIALILSSFLLQPLLVTAEIYKYIDSNGRDLEFINTLRESGVIDEGALESVNPEHITEYIECLPRRCER